MHPHRLLRFAVVALCLTTAATALANAGHHSGGGGSAGSEGPCIRWEKLDSGTDFDAGAWLDPDASTDDSGRVIATPSLDAGADADASDASAAADATDDASPDASPGSDSHAGELCVEHAGVSGCSVRGIGEVDTPSGLLAVVTLLVATFVARRRRDAANGLGDA